MEYRLSPSSLNLLRDCERCFWLLYRRGISRPKTPVASIATGLDIKIKQYFNLYRNKGILPPIIADWFAQKKVQLVPKPLSFLKFVDDEGVMFVGKLDEALIFDGTYYAPLDYKTRSSPASSVHAAYQLQMDAYDLLFQKNGYITKGSAFLAYFIPQFGELHKGFPFVLDMKEVVTKPQRALDFINRAKEVLLNEDIPQSSASCQFCSYINELSEKL